MSTFKNSRRIWESLIKEAQGSFLIVHATLSQLSVEGRGTPLNQGEVLDRIKSLKSDISPPR